METAELQRDMTEIELYNKREIFYLVRGGLEIVLYWLRRTNEVSLSLTYGDQTREFIVPNGSAGDATEHPEYYAAKAGMPRQTFRPDVVEGQAQKPA